MFARFSHTDDENVNVYFLLHDSGEVATRFQANGPVLWPYGSALSAEYEHPEGIMVTEDQVLRHGWLIDGKDPAAVALGRKGGLAKSPAKSKSSAANAKLGGRPATTLPSGRYSIIVRNPQGASDGMTGTAAEINAWLRGWSDPECLTAQVVDENDHAVAYKPVGRKTIKW